MSHSSVVAPRVKGLRRMVRPLTIGLSIGHLSGGGGTLGAFVTNKKKDVFVLSARHVLAPTGAEKVGDRIHQPASSDAVGLTPRTRIASLHAWTKPTASKPIFTDAAIALLDDDIAHVGNIVPTGLGCPIEGWRLKPIRTPEMPNISTRVGKIGRTTGYTEGTVTAIELGPLKIAAGEQLFVYENMIEVTATGAPFSAPGDGGAVVFTLDTMEAIGLLFASAMVKDSATHLSYVCPLRPILAHFHMTWLAD